MFASFEAGRNLKNFAVNCEEGNCVCEGFPNPNVKDSLLRGKVTLEECKKACTRRNICYGFEFWSNHPEIDSANCFECPTFPGKSYSISVIKNLDGHNDWATVYTKATKPPNKKKMKSIYTFEIVTLKFFSSFVSYYHDFIL